MTFVITKSKRAASVLLREVSNLVHSATQPHLPRVLANSMPKAGTNLLNRLLTLLGFKRHGFLDVGPNEGLEHVSKKQIRQVRRFLTRIRPGLFSVSHFYSFPEIDEIIGELGIRTLTIVRDPRDVCVSDVYFIRKNPSHRLHPYYVKMSLQEGLTASIVGMDTSQLDGAPPSFDIGSHYRNYLGWARQGVGLVVRFEELIGQKGRGDDQIQTETVSRIAEYLGLKLSDKELAAVCSGLFWTKAETFRKGQIGSWREHFTPEHRAAFERVFVNLMEDFGYEDNDAGATGA